MRLVYVQQGPLSTTPKIDQSGGHFVLSGNKSILPFAKFHKTGFSPLDLSKSQLGAVEDFNRKVKAGEIALEHVQCLCGHMQFRLIATIDRYSIHQDTVYCEICGLVQSNPRMTKAAYRQFYSSDEYRQIYESSTDSQNYESRYTSESNFGFGTWIYEGCKSVLAKISDMDIIEIGAGGGWNLLPFQMAGAMVTGVDFSPSLVELGQQHGINMKLGSVEALEGKYDLIIMNHVLEHFSDPITALKKVIKHLKADGYLYIGVLNILNFSITQLQNAHVYYFSPKTFRYYCALAALSPIVVGEQADVHMYGIFQPDEQVVVPDPRAGLGEIRRKLLFIKAKEYLKCLLGR